MATYDTIGGTPGSPDEDFYEYCLGCGALLFTVPESLCGYCADCGGEAYDEACRKHHEGLLKLLAESEDGIITIEVVDEEPRSAQQPADYLDLLRRADTIITHYLSILDENTEDFRQAFEWLLDAAEALNHLKQKEVIP